MCRTITQKERSRSQLITVGVNIVTLGWRFILGLLLCLYKLEAFDLNIRHIHVSHPTYTWTSMSSNGPKSIAAIPPYMFFGDVVLWICESRMFSRWLIFGKLERPKQGCSLVLNLIKGSWLLTCTTIWIFFQAWLQLQSHQIYIAPKNKYIHKYSNCFNSNSVLSDIKGFSLSMELGVFRFH